MISYEEIVQRFALFNCKLLTTKEEFNEGGMNGNSKYNIIFKCGHQDFSFVRNIAISNICTSCTAIRGTILPYEDMLKKIEGTKCELLTTKDEYETRKMNTDSEYRFMMSCGHEKLTRIANVTNNNLCFACTNLKYKTVSHEDIAQRFADLHCKLLTTKEEFEENNMNSKSIFKYTAMCGHENSSRFKSVKEQPIKNCKKCIREKNQNIVYERIKERFREIGLPVLTTVEQFVENNMNIMSDFKVICLCGHERTTAFYSMDESDYRLCKECTLTLQGENKRLNYDEVERRFIENGLELITTQEQYDSEYIQTSSPIKYKAKCGHERTTKLGSVLRCEIFNCLSCTFDAMVIKLKEKSKTEEGISSGNMLEYKALCLLRDNIKDKMELRKLGEGTLADCLVRPIGCKEDIWLQIQLKSTKEKTRFNEYRFDMKKKDYSGMIVICTCVDDERFFFYDGVDIKDTSTLHISLRKENKIESEIPKINLTETLIHRYNNFELFDYELMSFGDADVPLFIMHKREREFIVNRETKLPFIKFEYQEIDNMVYDFIINGFKIQEKVCQIDMIDKTIIKCTICKNKYRNGKKSIRGPYCKGDNNFYWFHHPNKELFYVIPEEVMLKWDKLETDTNDGRRSIRLYPYHSIDDLENKMTKEANDYLFFYDNLDISKLKLLFNIN
jgi:hypothetical protein